LVLLSLTIITFSYRGDAQGVISKARGGANSVFLPVQSGVHSITRPIGGLLAGALSGGGLQEENAKLRFEVGELQQQTLAEGATKNALQALERLDQLPVVQTIPHVTAQVIEMNSSDFAATLQLDVGTDNGVEKGMPVVGGGGLVGSVIETASRTSTVRLITDSSSEVGVRFGSSGLDLALSQGNGIDRALSVHLIPVGTPLRDGEVLTTSGLQGAAYPPLVPVARITVSESVTSNGESIKAEPVANLASLEYVDVLQW
jgi:rod shape-determining protein MreC